MASEVGSAFNPIGWVQIRLAGGINRVLAMCGIYAGAMLALNIFIYRSSADYRSLSQFAAGSLILTLGISGVLLVLVGSGVINKAILRDYTSDMITSHRCSAMSGYTAVLGYLTGPTLSIQCFTLVNIIACMILARLAGLQWYAPILIFGAFACGAAVTWTASVLSALSYRGKVAIAGIVTPIAVILIVPPLQEMMAAHPGFSLLTNLQLVSRLASAAGSTLSPDDGMLVVVSMLFQLAMALTFFIGASRRYLRDDVPAFTPTLALGFVALCTLACAAGMRMSQPSQPRIVSPEFAETSTQLLASIASLALVAVLPVSNAAWRSVAWNRRKRKDPNFKDRRPRGMWEAAIASALVVFGVLGLVAPRQVIAGFDGNLHWPIPDAIALVIASFLLFMLAAGGLMRIAYCHLRSAGWLTAIFVVVLWAFPLLAEMFVQLANEFSEDDPATFLFGISPLGTWIILIKDFNGPVWPGLAIQAGLAACLQLFARRSRY
ncbi:MAG: hypothetical protein KF841_05050 [Phycisphaerae bacterium]|nr:hypothetical protein [Phycisphaerae bacterium]